MHAIGAFLSLYLATLVLLASSGLFNTFIGLRLSEQGVSDLWVGGLIAAYYLGLVFGARAGHRLIIGVGHIRAYAASAAVVTACVLVQILTDSLGFWLVLRFVAGAAMVTQFMGIESWLNEQTDNNKRGTVFAFYMLMSSLGMVLGQLSLTLFSDLNYQPLVFVAICSVMSLIPIALTRRMSPALQVPAPINARYYLDKVPLSLMVLFIAGMITGAFYGLAPVYGVRMDLNTEQVAMFVAASVFAGVLAQWPVGWLADRYDRVKLIRVSAILITALAIPLWGWFPLSFAVLVSFSVGFGILQFTLYPLGAAFANDNVEPDRRVGLSAIMYMVYGLGACIGPIVASSLMNSLGSEYYYIFVTACGAALMVIARPAKVSGDHLSHDAPTDFVPMPDSLQSSAVAVALDPRVDMESDVSHDGLETENFEPDGTWADSTSGTEDVVKDDPHAPSAATLQADEEVESELAESVHQAEDLSAHLMAHPEEAPLACFDIESAESERELVEQDLAEGERAEEEQDEGELAESERTEGQAESESDGGKGSANGPKRWR